MPLTKKEQTVLRSIEKDARGLATAAVRSAKKARRMLVKVMKSS